jgi:hypothetical protein
MNLGTRLPETSSTLFARRENAVVPTAQETYREMVKAELAPGLRALGFNGSRRKYQLPDPDHWALLGLQASQWSDSGELRFTVNLLVVSRRAWERESAQRPYLGAKPTANTHPGGFAWWVRIGRLMPENLDKWWIVRAGAKTERLAREVLETIEIYGLPAMHAQMRGS